MGNKCNLTGQKFGKLTVICLDKSNNGKRYWKCKCECGNIVYVMTSNLNNGNTKSCGCLKKENNSRTTHGYSNTKIYHLWQGMKQRCCNKNALKYKNYGGREIKVCDEWKNNFMSFYNWAMENGYDENKNRKEQSLDRIDNNGNYEPNNCRLISHSINCRNRNNNILLTKNMQTKTIAEWCEILNLSQSNVSFRAKKYKNIDEILSQENLLRKKHKSNTGEFGISKDKANKFQLYLNHKYLGQFKTLEDAVKRREEILNDTNK